MLRREGLYQSHMEKWRGARDRGTLASTPERAVVAPAGQATAQSAAERRLLAENARLESELAKAKAVLAVVGKAHAYAGDSCQVGVLPSLVMSSR